MISQSIADVIQEGYKTIHWVFDRFLCIGLKDDIVISVNGRLRRCVGRANLSKKRIEIAKFIVELTPKQQKTVFVHEACHLVDAQLFNSAEEHSPTWAMLMQFCGESPFNTICVDRKINV